MNKKNAIIFSALIGLGGSCIIEYVMKNISKTERDRKNVVDSCNTCIFVNKTITSKLDSVIYAIRHSPCSKGQSFDAELSSIIASSSQNDATKMLMIDTIASAVLSSVSKNIDDGRATIEGAIIALKNMK